MNSLKVNWPKSGSGTPRFPRAGSRASGIAPWPFHRPIWSRATASPRARERSPTTQAATAITARRRGGRKGAPADPAAPKSVPAGEIALREIRYDARLSDDEARFTADIDADATAVGESSVTLFEGDVAVLPGKLPDSLKI